MRIRRKSPQCLVTPRGPFPTPSSWPEHPFRDYSVTTTPDQRTRGMIDAGNMSAAVGQFRPTLVSYEIVGPSLLRLS